MILCQLHAFRTREPRCIKPMQSNGELFLRVYAHVLYSDPQRFDKRKRKEKYDLKSGVNKKNKSTKPSGITWRSESASPMRMLKMVRQRVADLLWTSPSPPGLRKTRESGTSLHVDHTHAYRRTRAVGASTLSNLLVASTQFLEQLSFLGSYFPLFPGARCRLSAILESSRHEEGVLVSLHFPEFLDLLDCDCITTNKSVPSSHQM